MNVRRKRLAPAEVRAPAADDQRDSGRYQRRPEGLNGLS